MPKAEGAPNGEALWRFSLAFYAVPGVARALIALQDHDGFDVNLMLFALWLGVSGHERLTSDGLASAEGAIRPVRTEFIEPMRSLRRKLRHHPDEDVRRLREGVKELELEGEKVAQARLAGLARDLPDAISRGAGLENAYRNLALYLGPKAAGGSEATLLREALEAFASGY
jgi:uncharacterized protein (TIGR02444 family)